MVLCERCRDPVGHRLREFLLENTDLPVLLWPFQQAPEVFRRLSQNGGDEDWIAFVPCPRRRDVDLDLLFGEGTRFGVCCVDKYPVGRGEIWIGCHS